MHPVIVMVDYVQQTTVYSEKEQLQLLREIGGYTDLSLRWSQSSDYPSTISVYRQSCFFLKLHNEKNYGQN